MNELTPEQIKALQEENAELKKANSEKDQALETAATMVEEQSKKIDELKVSNPNFKPEVAVGKKTYRINHGVRDDKGQVHSIADIEKNTDLIKALVKSESTAVTDITE